MSFFNENNVTDIFSDIGSLRSRVDVYNDIYIPPVELMIHILEDYKKGKSRNYLSNDEIKSLKISRKKFECSICLNEKTRGVKLKCSHMFCKKCISTWLYSHNNCPNCRHEV